MKLLTALSLNYDSSPYFLRHYLRLKNQNCEDNRNIPIIIGHKFGYIFGEINPTLRRNSILVDIYFIYVMPSFRDEGKGRILYSFFEAETVKRYYHIAKAFPQMIQPHLEACIQMNIGIKHCIKKSTIFWNKNGFAGDTNSSQLTKFVYIKTK